MGGGGEYNKTDLQHNIIFKLKRFSNYEEKKNEHIVKDQNMKHKTLIFVI